MALAAFDCPHCYTRRSSFKSAGQYPYKDLTNPEDFSKFSVFYICQICEEPILVKYLNESAGRTIPHGMDADPEKKGYKKISTMPLHPLTETFLKDHPSILNYYQQMKNNFKDNRWDSVGMMGRKIVDVSTKKLLPTVDKLHPRIDALVKNGKINQELGKWAHEIRLDGNDASHEEEEDKPFDPQSAEELVMFVEAFLIFHYQIPLLLEKRNLRKAALSSKSKI